MNKLKKKKLVKIATFSAPIVALVIAALMGLDLEAQKGIEEALIQLIVILAGGAGVAGVASNTDKPEE